MATTTQPIQEQTEAAEQSAPERQPEEILRAVVQATDERARSFEYITRVAKPMAVSGLFGANYEQAIAKMMVGDALGIHPAVAMQQLHLIEGKVSMSAGLMLSLARQRGWSHHVKQRDTKACVIQWTSPSGTVTGESSWTEEDARRVKIPAKEGKERSLLDKDNWRNYPRNMLFARAVSDGIRTFCPEITNGITAYTPEEIEDILPANSKPEIKMPERASAKVAEPNGAAA